MDMSGGSGDGPTCKISMLWNWYTIDACFLAQSWHVSSHGVFALSCIGVVLLVMSLEFLRRVGKAYDLYVIGRCRQQISRRASGSSAGNETCATATTYHKFGYTPLQQAIRSVIHMVTFGVAYFVMLLAMYFNGYIIMSILFGALLGKFVFDWEPVNIPVGGDVALEPRDLTKADQELTYCCG